MILASCFVSDNPPSRVVVQLFNPLCALALSTTRLCPLSS